MSTFRGALNKGFVGFALVHILVATYAGFAAASGISSIFDDVKKMNPSDGTMGLLGPTERKKLTRELISNSREFFLALGATIGAAVSGVAAYATKGAQPAWNGGFVPWTYRIAVAATAFFLIIAFVNGISTLSDAQSLDGDESEPKVVGEIKSFYSTFFSGSLAFAAAIVAIGTK